MDHPRVSSITYHCPMEANHRIFERDICGPAFDTLNFDNKLSLFFDYEAPGNALLFLAQLRHAVDQAIKYHLEN